MMSQPSQSISAEAERLARRVEELRAMGMSDRYLERARETARRSPLFSIYDTLEQEYCRWLLAGAGREDVEQ